MHTSLGETVSDGTIALRLNDITDASSPATSSTWITYNVEAHAYGVYRFSLTPPPSNAYLIANVTVTNALHAEISFDYGHFVLVARDGTAYYASYAVCNSGCSAQALQNSTLNETFTSDVYVLFSVPTGTQPTQIAHRSYPASCDVIDLNRARIVGPQRRFSCTITVALYHVGGNHEAAISRFRGTNSHKRWSKTRTKNDKVGMTW